MPNPTGRNSPESFDQFAPSTPYGDKKKAGAMTKMAPLAGGGGSHALGTPQRATEVALKSAQDQNEAQAQAQNQQEPVIPPPLQTTAVADPYQDIWDQIAATPGASDLVKQYAASA